MVNRSPKSRLALHEVEHVWITISDGTRLSARLWLPVSVHSTPVPAILEYMPYRKRDHGRNRDDMMHGYFAQHGYACVRVDTRGSGDSEGVLTDEFTRQQTLDGVDVVNWIASQPWCTGSVGMIGRSWSGFSALQVAAHAPQALKAIIPVCASMDRYRYGLHYAGGCFLTDNLHWTTTMLMLNMRPPDDALVGPDASRMWMERLDANQPWIDNWLRHQTDDSYYAEGSTAASVAQYRCAVYFVGGWCDHFASAVMDAASRFEVPFRGLIGPWAHHFGHDGAPGPRIGWLQDCLRWWDRWLKNIDNGITREPRIIAWIYEPTRPAPFHVRRGGRWVGEPRWPRPLSADRTYFLGERRLSATPLPNADLPHCTPLSVGMAAGGDWCRLGVNGEAPLDQREDDARCLSFDSDTLSERFEILGAPVLHLRIASDQPTAQIAVRLNDVAPDGTSARVSYGFLNLTHRDSHRAPKPLQPGVFVDVAVRLNDIGHAFLPGHRVRVSISTSYWPYIWPSPTRTTITLRTEAARLVLPERRPRDDDAGIVFAEPASAPSTPITVLEPAKISRVYSRDLLSGQHTLTLDFSGGYLGPGRLYRLDALGIVLGHAKTHQCQILDDDPLSARYAVNQTYNMSRNNRTWRFASSITMSATEHTFLIGITAHATENGSEIWSRNWQRQYPRQLV